MAFSLAMTQLDYSTILLFTSTIVVFVLPIFIIFPPVPVERSDVLRQTHSKLGQPLPRLAQGAREASDPDSTKTSGGASGEAWKTKIYPVLSCRGVGVQGQQQQQYAGCDHDGLYAFAVRARRAPSSGDQEQEAARGVRQGQQAKATTTTTTGVAADHQYQWQALTRGDAPPLADVEVDVWLPDPAKSSRLLGHVEGGFVVVRFPWTDHGPRGLVQVAAAKLSRGLRAVPQREMLLPLEVPSETEIDARGYRQTRVVVGGESCPALSMETEVPPELARYLGVDVVERRLGIFRLCDWPGNQRDS
ncbi:MOSC domain-containing protein [Purpureocillium lavendulum]|uniref:MOSC domain-containing protein n=1 Tax=Purpureocillium lavendulum TaxID=1247861 RepID=A0AB34FZQ4_9HYPO|nr:MOSC domain-containing protein [Purpureocillium lavendulum]